MNAFSSSLLGQFLSALLNAMQAHPYITLIIIFVVFLIMMFSKATSSYEHAGRR